MSDKQIVQGYDPQDKRPYVYGLFYPESMGGTCFYVGKGTRRRIFDHEWLVQSEKERNLHKSRAIKKIWAAGGQVQKVIFFYFETEQEAFLYEIASIFLFSGKLTNLTDGGEGTMGASLETRQKMSRSRKGRIVSEETRAKLRKRLHSEESRRKMSRSQKGRVVSEEARRKLSEMNKGKTLSEEHRRKMSEAQKRRWQEGYIRRGDKGRKLLSLEHRHKLSENRKGRTHSEETRAKISNALKNSTNSGRFQKNVRHGPMPKAQKAKISQSMKNHKRNPGELLTAEQKVIALLQSQDTPLAPKRISELTGIKSIRKLMRRMLAEKLIIQTAYGLYQLPGRAVQ